MKYFNNICLDCRNRQGARNQSESPKCRELKIENPVKKLYKGGKEDFIIPNILDYNIHSFCNHFKDKHILNLRIFCDYRKYDDELTLVKRLTRILNSDLGVAEFEGALLDYLRNNANERMSKED